ncbi:Uncharacterised protein [Pandoraea pnomenusa]|uniref:Uncharacterized protein n=1 Tax=Pandoraea pnomenusa TaxID=93220 RepID=A0A379KD83_9BURK|nr:hypothetical protein [Pandoraea pnomenusa]SUD65831.1 Uncharacterised protein [Pandoraea pnomenusa]
MSGRHIEAIFCDDIRNEIGNKMSFMGVYLNDMHVSDFPITIPKLCIFASVHTAIEKPFKELELVVRKDGETISSIKFEPESLVLNTTSREGFAPPTRAHAGAALIFSPFQFDGPCRLDVVAITEEGELTGPKLYVTKALAPAT